MLLSLQRRHLALRWKEWFSFAVNFYASNSREVFKKIIIYFNCNWNEFWNTERKKTFFFFWVVAESFKILCQRTRVRKGSLFHAISCQVSAQLSLWCTFDVSWHRYRYHTFSNAATTAFKLIKFCVLVTLFTLLLAILFHTKTHFRFQQATYSFAISLKDALWDSIPAVNQYLMDYNNQYRDLSPD